MKLLTLYLVLIAVNSYGQDTYTDSAAYYSIHQQYFNWKIETAMNDGNIHIHLGELCKQHHQDSAGDYWYVLAIKDELLVLDYLDSASRYMGMKIHWQHAHPIPQIWMHPFVGNPTWSFPKEDSNGYNFTKPPCPCKSAVYYQVANGTDFITPKTKTHEIHYSRNAIITYTVMRSKITRTRLARLRRIRT